ncbi:lipoprotein N-acyltransferase Lnb domain-containing protein [Flavivirga eckloniae]|uniref:Uncharacterized protein n=1 Tax=Flavivirga eckloniae TaxID=1803846 RepID=A0A2K9PM79_9FLAO|nr:DUF4105 domain-containing protein [Flavivirga eckloniae]AUP78162.1 hypothetical protein C1H87_05305 [Flavivirga eckloniae]
MHKTLLFLFLFLFVEISAIAQKNTLSPNAEISVLTIGPGTSLNDAFGHSAFRIKDSSGIDVVFNYGVYDFEAPYFILKFAQGKLNYLIGVDRYADFYGSYTAQNRTIKEQVLNLTEKEKQILFDYLLNNIKPENRRYLYDFFFDNCATKIKDVANISLNNTIVFNTPEDQKEATFRTLIQNNLNRNSWGSFGIDLALGSVIDKNATAEEHMFLPENIYHFFAIATINNKPLVKKSQVLYTKRDTSKPNTFFTSPLFILGIIGALILFITYRDLKKNKQSVWLDAALFSITGLIGIMLLLLWFATDHKGTHQNYNLLWACALNILVIPQLFRKAIKPWFIKYLKFLVILLCLLTLHWIIGVQVFAIGAIPLLIALFIRYIYLISYYNRR